MKKDLTLVILAAGMGSRFGGLKQIEPFGPNKEFLIDYSIYDAIKAGFNKVVFVIKKENYEIFWQTIGKRIEDKINVSYVFQDINTVPDGVVVPSERVKPWGTAHAILACKNVVNENFMIINADDFYGRSSYEIMSDYLQKTAPNSFDFAMVGYKAKNTMAKNGSVKRGICKTCNNYLVSIVESSLYYENNVILAYPLANKNDIKEIEQDTYVSMNMFGFTKEIFGIIEKNLNKFFFDNKADLTTCEYTIPDIIENELENKTITVKVLETNAKWMGVTYKEDKEDVVNKLNKMIAENIYNEKLW